MRKKKHPKDSFIIKTELVFPNDTNPINHLMGGKMLHWMDVIAAISAIKHSSMIVTTVSVDNVSFSHPIKLGCVVTLNAFVTRSFNTSMEVYIEVWAEDMLKDKKVKSNEAFYTFVAIDQAGNKIDVPEVIPETEREIELYSSALKRRQLRLVLAGKMKYADAEEIRDVFKL